MSSLDSFFFLILQASATANVVVGVILLIRWIFKSKLGARWQYCLWIILILRLLLPYSPESQFSLYNIFISPDENIVLSSAYHTYENSEMDKEERVADKIYVAASSVSAAVIVPRQYLNAISYRYHGIDIKLISGVWLFGLITFGILNLIVNLRFWLKIRKFKGSYDEGINNILENCKKVMKVKRDIPVVFSSVVGSPAIHGIFKQRLLMPPGIRHTLGEGRLKYVILHELAHYKRKDLIVNAVSSIIHTLHWFNPLIWYAFYKMRQDRELACDALALSYVEPEECREYGETIIDILKNSTQPIRISSALGVLSSKSQIKRRIKMISIFNKKAGRWTIFAIVLIILLGCTALTSATGMWKKDNIDYPFVDDQQVIGKWQSVDFVNTIEQFNPESMKWNGELYLNEMVFMNGGEMLTSIEGGPLAPGPWTWTKDIVIHPGDKTASKYIIKEMNGSTYMFFEWKSGDYIFSGLAPKYYVLKKIDSKDNSNYEGQRKEDNVEYTFENDPQMLGNWQSVDFVRSIDDFIPGTKGWSGGFFLIGMCFEEGGALTLSCENGKGQLEWTKGFVINKGDKTASKCIVKEIKGSTYMFFEWKSGDYVYRGMDPYYYVLKKVE